jgi:hypothetical protein
MAKEKRSTEYRVATPPLSSVLCLSRAWPPRSRALPPKARAEFIHVMKTILGPPHGGGGTAHSGIHVDRRHADLVSMADSVFGWLLKGNASPVTVDQRLSSFLLANESRLHSLYRLPPGLLGSSFVADVLDSAIGSLQKTAAKI